MRPQGTPRLRRIAAGGLIAACLAVELGPGVSGASEATTVQQGPRTRQVLVVTANLEEAWDARDNADAGDLAAFVRRLEAVAPHAPDILLLQEVTHGATRDLIRLLKAHTSFSYGIATPAGRSPVRVQQRRVLTRETAILINLRTMKEVGKSRYVDTTYASRHGKRGTLREVKRNAAALVRERTSGMTFPVASVHFHTPGQLRSASLSRRYRTTWARKVAGFVSRTWPQHRRNAVIGGDFNAPRNLVRKNRKVAQPWWKRMVRGGFRDSVWEVAPLGGVDYVFTRTRIAGAAADRTYDPAAAAGTPAYYADHKLRWALLGRWRPLASADAVSSTGVEVAWKPVVSARSFAIQRRGPGASGWRTVHRTGRVALSIRDRGLAPRTTYRYRVLAWNGADWSDPSRIMRVRTRRDSLPPRRPSAPRVRLKVSPLAVTLGWQATADRGGSGTAEYEVWRTELGHDAVKITTTDRRWYVDKKFTKKQTIEYFIVAVDHAGNRSMRSESASVVPRVTLRR